MISTAPGVLPDRISANSQSNSWLIFVDLGATDPEVWMRDVATPAVSLLTAAPQVSEGPDAPSEGGEDNRAVAVCTVGFGVPLFTRLGSAAQVPVGLGAPLPGVVSDAHDIFFYVFSLEDARVADFLRRLTIGSPGVTLDIQRGYQRSNRKEVFGQTDGLRNVLPKTDRAAVAFVGPNQPDEPEWAVGGSYMSYLKIKQDVAAWSVLTVERQAEIMGRQADGSRVDLQAGTAPDAEPPMVAPAPTPLPNSHVRKAGPHRDDQDETVRILRRGTPFVECGSDGKLAEGLHFVSYQASIDAFVTILQRWMLNAGFPTDTAGQDALFAGPNPLASFVKGGIYFAVPEDERFIGAGVFEAAPTSMTGVLQLRLVVTGANGQPDLTAALNGAQFSISGGAQPATATTNDAGHATVNGLPVGVELTVTQTSAPPKASLGATTTQPITLQPCVQGLLRFSNPHAATGY